MANGPDNMEIEILPDGTIKFTTDRISAANHASAEEFLKFATRLAGGETTVTRRNRPQREVQSQQVRQKS